MNYDQLDTQSPWEEHNYDDNLRILTPKHEGHLCRRLRTLTSMKNLEYFEGHSSLSLTADLHSMK